MRLELHLPGLPPIPSNGPHGHHMKSARERNQWRVLAAWTLLAEKAKVPGPWPTSGALLTLTRHSATEPDPDNLAISFKPLVDGIADALGLPDDSRKHVQRVVRWEKAPTRKGYVSVGVEPWSPEDSDSGSPAEPLRALEEKR